MEIRFKQFCYTHTTSGINRSKGWQAVGASGMDFFQPLLPRIQSAITIPEAANLQKEVADEKFRIFGLRKIDKYPALIRITDAGLTSDGRPGNIFVHILLPYKEEGIWDFYQCDILSVFNAWPEWLDNWAGEANANMREVEIKVNPFPDEGQLKKAQNLLEGKVSLDKMIYAAGQALHPKKPQYLLIQPAVASGEEGHLNYGDEQMIDLLSILWSWLPPYQRQSVQLWMGRNQIKLPSTNWNVLLRTDRKYIHSNMVDHIAHCFDFQHNNFSSKLFQDFESFNVDKKALAAQYAQFESVKNFFGYHGENETVYNTFLELIKEAEVEVEEEKDLEKVFNSPLEKLFEAFEGLSPADGVEEFRHSFECLLHLTDKCAGYEGEKSERFLEQAFALKFPPDFSKKKAGVITEKIEGLLWKSAEWEWHIGEGRYQGFIKMLVKGAGDIFGDGAPYLSSQFESIWRKLAVEAGTNDSAFQLFQGILLYLTANKMPAVQDLFRGLLKEKPDCWLYASRPEDEKRFWFVEYAQLMADRQPSQSSVGKLSELLITAGELDGLQEQVAMASVGIFCLNEEPKIDFWANAYRQRQSPDFLENYFGLLKRFMPSSISKEHSLLRYFIEKRDFPNAREEITTRLQAFPRLTTTAGQSSASGHSGYLKRDDVIGFFRKLLQLLPPPDDAKVLRDILQSSPETQETAALLLVALIVENFGSAHVFSKKRIQEARDLFFRFQFCFDQLKSAGLDELVLNNHNVSPLRAVIFQGILEESIGDPASDEGAGYFRSLNPYLRLERIAHLSEIEQKRQELLGVVLSTLAEASEERLATIAGFSKENIEAFSLGAFLKGPHFEDSITGLLKKLIRQFTTAASGRPFPERLLQKMEVVRPYSNVQDEWLKDRKSKSARLVLLYDIVENAIKDNLRWSPKEIQTAAETFHLEPLLREPDVREELSEAMAGPEVSLQQAGLLADGISQREITGRFSNILDLLHEPFEGIKNLSGSRPPLLDKAPGLYFYKWWYDGHDAAAYLDEEYLPSAFFIRAAEENTEGFLKELRHLLAQQQEKGLPLSETLTKARPVLANLAAYHCGQHKNFRVLDYLLDIVCSRLNSPHINEAEKKNLAGFVTGDLKSNSLTNREDWIRKVDEEVMSYALKLAPNGGAYAFMNLFSMNINNFGHGDEQKGKLQMGQLRRLARAFEQGRDNQSPAIPQKEVDFFQLRDFIKSVDSTQLDNLFEPGKRYDFQGMVEALNFGHAFDVCKEVEGLLKKHKQNLKLGKGEKKLKFQVDILEVMRQDLGFFPFLLVANRHSAGGNLPLPPCFRLLLVFDDPSQAIVEKNISSLITTGQKEVLQVFTTLTFALCQQGKGRFLEIFLEKLITSGKNLNKDNRFFQNTLHPVSQKLYEAIEGWWYSREVIPPLVFEFLELEGLEGSKDRLNQAFAKMEKKDQKKKKEKDKRDGIVPAFGQWVKGMLGKSKDKKP